MKATGDRRRATEVSQGGGRPAGAEGTSSLAITRSAGTRLSPVACIGEIIEADTLQLHAECPRLYAAAPFGSFVRVAGAERSVFGVVSHIETGTVDAGRQTQALHLPPERLAERMPQLALLLRTCFNAIVVGYSEGDKILPYLPPLPPEIHRFVYPCAPTEVEALTREPDFLRILATAEAPVEDVLAAAIRHGAEARGSGAVADAFIVECGKSVATLFRREPDRFQSVMRRLQAARRTAGAPWERPLDVV